MEQFKIMGARFSYAYIFTKMKDGGYQVDILWPKADQNTTNLVVHHLNQGIAQAQADPKFQNVLVQGTFKQDVIKDGARAKFGKKDYDTYKDCYYVVAKSGDNPVQVIDQFGKLLTNDQEFFSGCYGNAGVFFRLYNPSEKNPKSGYGISLRLVALQKTHGTEADRLSGTASVQATDFFGVQPAPMPGFGAPASPYGAAGPVAAPSPQPGQPYGQSQNQFGAQPQAVPGQYGQPVPGQVPTYPQQAPQPGFGAPATGQPTAFPQTQPTPTTPGQNFGVPQTQGNPFPQTGLPQQPVAQPGFQTGQPAQPQQPAGPHQPTPAFGAPQGFDPYAGQR